MTTFYCLWSLFCMQVYISTWACDTEILSPFIFHSHSLNDLIASFLRCIFMGFIQLGLSHTCIIHGWMNAWAELLGFADQEFYQVLSYLFYCYNIEEVGNESSILTHNTTWMLRIVGEWESAHAKLEARITLQYVQCPSQTYIEKSPVEFTRRACSTHQ